ncbi:MAG: hypothetical protein EP338_10355 [Bacteroidetes bacterium]|nr:MAG: hypothetical protein EP338_10355 [Bacteroidota bacterium]
MKNLVIVSLVSLSACFINAQSMLGKGGKQVNAGVGLSSWGIPVYAGMDFGVHPDISVGFEGSYRSYKEHWKFDDRKYRHSIMGFSGNVNYHFNTLLNIPKEWDLYAGANIGFYVWNSSSDYPGDHTSGLGLGGQLGIRYYFNEKFGLNLEGGGGNAFSGGKFGISIIL